MKIHIVYLACTIYIYMMCDSVMILFLCPLFAISTGAIHPFTGQILNTVGEIVKRIGLIADTVY